MNKTRNDENSRCDFLLESGEVAFAAGSVSTSFVQAHAMTDTVAKMLNTPAVND